MHIIGHCYSRDQIAAEHGGGTIEYLPNVEGRIVCACLRTERKFNPEAPRVILPGRGLKRERWANVLCKQRGSIPVYLRRAAHEWKFIGDYEVEDCSTSTANIARYEEQTGRPVTKVILMRKVQKHERFGKT
jgi:hypothetical protein